MSGALARHAQEQPGDLEAGREILSEILAAVRRVELLAAQPKPDPRLLAAAALRVTEAVMPAENLTARQISIAEIAADYYARGRSDMAAEVAARKRLRPVS